MDNLIIIVVIAGLAALLGAGVGGYLATQEVMRDVAHQATPVISGLADATTLLKEEAKAVTAASSGVERMSYVVIAFVALSVAAILTLLRVVKSAVLRDIQNNEEFRKAIREIVAAKSTKKKTQRK
jgi:hypothetical protein